MSYKKYYSKFLKANKGKLHLVAHSHHFWPDVTFEAQKQYWLDSAKFTDHKWDSIFSDTIPKAQKHIARILNLDHPEQIAFAPNTHEFIVRILSCFDPSKKIKILTTDSEFHSFRRQVMRLKESNNFEITTIPTEPFHTLSLRICDALKKDEHDLVFLSHVFFNSGVVLENLETIVKTLKPKTLFVLDGYHGFCAIPTNLKNLQDRIFYLAGGYKYAQAGEGACFLHIPKNCELRPVNTGWFASFSTLEKSNQKITYDSGAARFWGSTFDPSGLYRFNAVMDLFSSKKITIEKIHSHVQKIQQSFLKKLKKINLTQEQLISSNLNHHGHFLTFQFDSNEAAKDFQIKLEQRKISTDLRGNRLRFGFGMYHDLSDLGAFLK